MVRKSSGQDVQQPYTLVVFYKDRVYNIPIRFIAATQQYALGREKKGEEVNVTLFSLTVHLAFGGWKTWSFDYISVVERAMFMFMFMFVCLCVCAC